MVTKKDRVVVQEMIKRLGISEFLILVGNTVSDVTAEMPPALSAHGDKVVDLIHKASEEAM